MTGEVTPGHGDHEQVGDTVIHWQGLFLELGYTGRLGPSERDSLLSHLPLSL